LLKVVRTLIVRHVRKRVPLKTRVLDVQLEIRLGGDMIQTLREGKGGGLRKNFLQPLRPQFGLRIRGV